MIIVVLRTNVVAIIISFWMFHIKTTKPEAGIVAWFNTAEIA